MRRYVFLFLFLIAVASSSFGQISSDAFTIAAVRYVYLQPDQAVFSINVRTDVSTTAEQVVASLQSLSITLANLYSANIGSWSFTLAVPLSKLQATVTALTALQKPVQQSVGMLSFSVVGTQVSPQLQPAQQCGAADLIADAQKQAQQLATAAGFSVGPVLAVSDVLLSQSVAASRLSGSFAAIPIFNFVSVSAFLSPNPIYASPSFTCSLDVKFQLLRYHS